MDTITYNIGSKGENQRRGDSGGRRLADRQQRQKMDDNTIHIQDGKYTTCDQTDHPTSTWR